ncbi:MAG TPA: hypothetical protein ENK21_09425 [Trueperaceae bacterium]|nr:hypothetical protein [Trueperaceae bacterium]
MFPNEVRDLGGIKIINDSLVFVNDVDLLEIIEKELENNKIKVEIPTTPRIIIDQSNENKYVSDSA